MEQSLWKIFENINSWLQYAERKNTYLLTFIGLQLTLMKVFKFEGSGWLVSSIVFLFLCFFLCILSFFPETKIFKYLYFLARAKGAKEAGDNLLFYGHVAKYSVSGYVDKMEKHLSGTINDKQYLLDLCNQIVVNAGIATKKFNMFKVSFWLLLIGQVLFVTYLLVG